jgi:hypothetical protein
MKLAINLVLVAIIAFLLYALYNSIKEPIAFKAEKERRERVVVTQLMKIRQAQEAFRDITGVFAPNFDTLSQILNTGQFKVIQVFGDPDDPNFTGEITYDTLFVPAMDSMRKMLGMNNFDSLRYVPFSSGEVFAISADVIDYQSTKVPVVEVGTQRKAFMGRFADKRFARYDQKYDPESLLKFGNMFSPNLSGNWE